MFRNQVLSTAALEVFSHIINKTKACFVQFVQFEKKNIFRSEARNKTTENHRNGSEKHDLPTREVRQHS